MMHSVCLSRARGSGRHACKRRLFVLLSLLPLLPPVPPSQLSFVLPSAFSHPSTLPKLPFSGLPGAFVPPPSTIPLGQIVPDSLGPGSGQVDLANGSPRPCVHPPGRFSRLAARCCIQGGRARHSEACGCGAPRVAARHSASQGRRLGTGALRGRALGSETFAVRVDRQCPRAVPLRYPRPVLRLSQHIPSCHSGPHQCSYMFSGLLSIVPPH